MGKPPVWFRIP